MLKAFSGELAFCSNFEPCSIEYEGIVFPSVEHAYVAAKTKDVVVRRAIASIPYAGQAKKMGRSLKIRADWNDVRLEVMEQLLRKKFAHKHLAEKLKATGNKELVEENWWNDTFWGVCKGKGENNLGKLLMKIRAEL